MQVLYRISLWCYELIIWLVAPFHARARRFLAGRQDIFDQLKTVDKKAENQLIWIHAASVGEFEQGRPLIKQIRAVKGRARILLTFFSPSGYELHKDNPEVDFVFYLPVDSPKNAQRFLNAVKPDLAIFIKYEFWYYYMLELQARSVPLLFVSSVFRKNQMFFHSLGGFYRDALRGANHFFVQDSNSLTLLASIGIDQATLVGDTRFDRVLEVAGQPFSDPIIDGFVGDELVFVLGSTWESDWVRLEPMVRKCLYDFKFIIAPHNISKEHLRLYYQGDTGIKYSEAKSGNSSGKRILVMDNVGMLSSIYRYADIAYVGGAFRGALHNVLEPAVYGVPVLLGHDVTNDKFIEAGEMVSSGGALTFSDSSGLISIIDRLMTNDMERKLIGENARRFVKDRSGATAKVMKEIDLLI